MLFFLLIYVKMSTTVGILTIMSSKIFMLPVPGRPSNLGYTRAWAYRTGSNCGWGLLGHFFLSSIISLLSSSLWKTVRDELKYCIGIGDIMTKLFQKSFVDKSASVSHGVFLCHQKYRHSHKG